MVVVGDFNVDQLPTVSDDPFAGEEGRVNHHFEGRSRLGSFSERFGLQLSLPNASHGVPGGPFAEACLRAPISRIPMGLCTLTTKPSLIDYCLFSPDLLAESVIFWQGVPADHALVAIQLARPPPACRLTRKSHPPSPLRARRRSETSRTG